MKINIPQQIYVWIFFDQQMLIIRNLNYKFYDPKFLSEFDKPKKEKKI